MSTAAALPEGTQTMEQPVPTVHLSRFLRARRERVFAAWTDPKQVKQWMGPVGFVTIEAVGDVRTGGSYRVTMQGSTVPGPGEAPQQRLGIAEGEYLEVKPPELVRYTWRANWSPGEESTVTVRFHEEDGGTRLELTHEGFATRESAAGHTNGWNGSLDKLAAFVQA